MNAFISWLKNGPLITDGAWGTEFQKRGLPLGESPDSWNLDSPDLVFEVAKAYADAGSEIILTNTFRANAIAMPHCSTEQLAAINRVGVEISRQAAAGKSRVVASLGPTGKVLMMGDISPVEVEDAFRQQAEALAEGSPDALLLETMSDLEEAEIALRAAKSTGLPVIVSFAFDSGKNKDRTMMGVTPEQVNVRFLDLGADALGANCGAGVEHFAAVSRRLSSAGLPVWIKANAGLPSSSSTAGVAYSTSAEFFAAHLQELISAGASFVGGCCGTTPEFIRALVAARQSCASN